MPSLKIETEGIEGLDDLPLALERALERKVASAIKKSANAIRKEVRRQAPGPTVRKGVRTKVKGRGFDTKAEIYLAGAPANIVARGSPAHEIRPKKGRALRLPDGRFVSRIQHPGHPPNDFFQRGTAEAERIVEEQLNDVATAIEEVL